MKLSNCCARDVKAGDRIWLPTGVVKVVALEPAHNGIEATVESQAHTARRLWWWPQQGVHVQKRARRGQDCFKSASARAR